MSKLFKLFIAGLILTGVSNNLLASENTNLADSDSLQFSSDLINFASDDPNLSRLDIYTKVVFEKLQFIKISDAKFQAEYEVSVVVFSNHGEKIDSEKIKEKIVLDSIDETSSVQSYKLSKFRFVLPPDLYRVSIQLQDLETLKIGNHISLIDLKRYDNSQSLMTSDLLFLDFYSENENGEVDFLPRVSSTRQEDSQIYAYFEVYNLQDNDSIFVHYNIFDSDDQSVESNEYWIKSSGRITKNFIEIGGSRFPHGQYTAKVMLKTQNDTLTMERSFDWFLDGIPLSFTTLDQAIAVLRYIATEDEMAKFKLTTDREEKYIAFINFWKERDPSPHTAENEMRSKYYSRIEAANERFRGVYKDGWKTDMGWVYVVLGRPDNIERNAFNQEYAYLPGRPVKAIQVWDYYKYNRQLVFYDENGFGEFRLGNTETLYEILR